jgi:50S ribosomal protein L16 3-hydroxylase
MKPAAELQLDREIFLAQYWQRKPLLIAGAVPDFRPPITADELAGLAMEDDVESRIIEHRDPQWLLQHGPFEEPDFQRACPWTLLVQAVDHYVPEVACLRQLIDFLPQWRVDDIMVSYAVDGGSVGPHYDNYDVFLLQGEGERLWRLGQFCDGSSALLPHDDLRILAEFEPQAEYLLGPGDMLYVPPGVAHWGIGQGECTTFSIGFRAPRVNDMVSRWTDSLLETMDPELFYRDYNSEPTTRAGEIRPRDLERVQAQLQAALDQAVDGTWFGELVTEPRYVAEQDEDELQQSRQLLLGADTEVHLDPAAKLAWQEQGSGITVFANGLSQDYSLTVLPLIEELCENWQLGSATLVAAIADKEAMAALTFLLEAGVIDVGSNTD